MYYRASGDEFQVNTTSVRSQYQADLGRLADGKVIAVWIDADPNTTADRSVRAQLYAADGTAFGQEIILVTDTAIRPDVVGLADGGFVITWLGLGSVRAQVFDAGGAAVGNAFDLQPRSASSVNAPAITALADGGFAVAWDDVRTAGADTSGSGVHVSRFDARGAALLIDAAVNTSTSGNQADAAIASLAGGGFVVTWTDRGPRGSGAPWQIKGQIYDAAGAPSGSEFLVSDASTSGNAVESSMARLTNGDIVISWAGGGNQWIQRLDASGAKVGEQILLAGGMVGVPTVGPTIAALSNGGFAIAWQDNSAPASEGAGTAILVQAFDAAAAAVGEVMRANTQDAGDQIQPAIVEFPDGRFIVSWTDRNGSGSNDAEVRAQIFAPVYPAPTVTITSGGAADEYAVQIDENATAVTIVAATGSADTAVRYVIAGGADAALFVIDEETGELRFAAAPDFERPADEGADNGYEVVVEASAGSASDFQTLWVTIADTNEGPVVVPVGPLVTAENDRVVGVVSASDPEGSRLAFSIVGGADAALFAIDAATGEISFLAPPNYERRGSAQGTNDFDLVVAASDGVNSTAQALTVRVKDVDEGVVITSNGGGAASGFRVEENQTFATRVQAVDPDGGSVTYRIVGGADAALFAIDQSSGGVRFLSAPDFEKPADADRNGAYDVTVEASDGTTIARQTLQIDIANVFEAVAIMSGGGGDSAFVSIAENTQRVSTVAATGGDGGSARYAIVGGEDAGRFGIDAQSGALSFLFAPDFEAPQDADRDNSYIILVQASDGVSSDTQKMVVRVTDVQENRVVTGTNAGEVISPTASNAALRTSEGADEVYGQGGNDTIYGVGGNDILNGGAGNDALIGGAGGDRLIGGTGADLFIFQSISETRVSAADRIADFSRSEGDKIHLASIDANSNVSGDQAFTFIGTGGFTGVAGQLRGVFDGTDTHFFGDANGDKVADFEIVLSGFQPLEATDFVL